MDESRPASRVNKATTRHTQAKPTPKPKPKPKPVNLIIGNYLSPGRRLASYKNKWPHASPPAALMSAAGFYYHGSGTLDPSDDLVECPSCDLSIDNWEAADDPFEVHTRTNRQCRFAQVLKGDHERQQEARARKGEAKKKKKPAAAAVAVTAKRKLLSGADAVPRKKARTEPSPGPASDAAPSPGPDDDDDGSGCGTGDADGVRGGGNVRDIGAWPSRPEPSRGTDFTV